MPQPWTSLRTLRLEPWSQLLSSTFLVSSCESSAASCLILFATQSSSFYLLSYDASTKSPGAGQSSNNALGGPNSPKARSSSPSPLSLILLSLSLHFSLFQTVPTFHPPRSPPVSLMRRMLCVRLPGRYWPDSSSASSIDWAGACAQPGFLPAHWSAQLVHSPTCRASKAHSCLSESISIHPSPSRFIAVECNPAYCRKPCTHEALGHIAASRQIRVFESIKVVKMA